MGGVLAELLAREGRQVTLVTPAAHVSAWTMNTMEQPRIQRRLLELGVTLELSHTLVGRDRRRGAHRVRVHRRASVSSAATRSCSSPRACRTTASARSCSRAAASGRRPASLGAHRRRRVRAGHDRERGLGRAPLRRGARRPGARRRRPVPPRGHRVAAASSHELPRLHRLPPSLGSRAHDPVGRPRGRAAEGDRRQRRSRRR